MAKKKTEPKRTKPSLSGEPGPSPRLIIRAPDAERETWVTKAKAAGMTLSAWIRRTLNRAKK